MNYINVQDIKKYAVDSHWSRDNVFSFFSHNNVNNNSFPCNTGRVFGMLTVDFVQRDKKVLQLQKCVCFAYISKEKKKKRQPQKCK